MNGDVTTPLPARCGTCRRQGLVMRSDARPAWCVCGKGKRGRGKLGGPYLAPPGHVTRFLSESAPAAAHREQGRLLGNAERQARDAMLAGSWAGYRRGRRRFVRTVPRSNPNRRHLERAYAVALRALRAFQKACPTRSIFRPACCDVCHRHVGPTATRGTPR